MSRQDALVSADWAEQNLDAPNTVFVEVDEDTTAYDGGHIPGAVKLDWKTELQDQVRRDFVDKAGFEKLLSAKGIGNDDTVILYGGNNNWFAAYAYWYFKLYGHQAVKLLDGGRKKWELDGRKLDTEVPQRSQTSYTAKEQDTSIRAFRDEVVNAIGTKNLVDVRSPDEFSGKLLAPAHLPQEQAQRGGHIPSALNVPWSKAANEDGTFKSDDELRKLYEEQGLDSSRSTIAYCRIGERSSHTWFALHELLGESDVKNYDGSWTEYGSLIGVPIETGPGQRGVVPDVRSARADRRTARRHRPREGVRAGRQGHSRAARPSAGPTSGSSTAPASSPPRSCRRPPGTTGSSRPRAPGPSARSRAPATASPRSPSVARACSRPRSPSRPECQRRTVAA